MRSASYQRFTEQLDAEISVAESNKSDGDARPDPTPLPDALPPVDRFDLALMPEALRPWIADIAHRMQCPVDFPAVGALTALSSLIGARAVMAPKALDDWQVVPNLWGLAVGRSGVMKSPALNEALKPLHELEKNERESWKAAHEAWTLDCKVSAMVADAREKEARGIAAKDPTKARALLEPTNNPDEPKVRRYVVNDATVEKLGDLLITNHWGILVYRDEIHGLLCSMDRQGQENARGFYLTGYDGNQGHAVDRIGRGETYVPKVCIAMLGGIQPGKVQSYVREAVSGGTGDDGLLQRFALTVWPDIDQPYLYIDRPPDDHAKQLATRVFDRLGNLQSASETEPVVWHFTEEAQAIFQKWLVPFETELRGDELHPALVSHLSKYRKLVPALSLIFALIDTPEGKNQIQARELTRALAWADYLRTHAERLYSAATVPETASAANLLSKIRSGKLTGTDGTVMDEFTPRQVAVKHWTGLGTPDAVCKAAELLSDYGWLARVARHAGVSGGRPSQSFQIHPSLRKRRPI
jgi:putative DNA primase/helicase